MNKQRSSVKGFILDKPTRKYLELLPIFREKRAQQITTLIMTFIAMSFFGLFAINPTLSTISQLQKQLEDARFVNQKLREKITALNTLQQEYIVLEADLPSINAALPSNPVAMRFAGQLVAVANQANVTIEKLSLSKTPITKTKAQESYIALPFTIEVKGTYLDIVTFATTLKNFERIVTLDSFGLTNTEKSKVLSVSISGNAYLKPEKE